MTSDEIKKWVKDKTNQDEIVKQFFKQHPPQKKKLAFFMAGVPGAGKTEFAENTINSVSPKLVPIEHDKLVEYIKGYKPEDYYKFRTAGSILVTRILDECLKSGYSFIFDGTLSHEKGYRNIQKALKKDYFVQVVYIIQEAKIAWSFTKDRELKTKRSIEKQGFINTCEKINESLLDIFKKFKGHAGFGLWIFNKNGEAGVGAATSIIYSQEIGSENEVEKALQESYNVGELE